MATTITYPNSISYGNNGDTLSFKTSETVNTSGSLFLQYPGNTVTVPTGSFIQLPTGSLPDIRQATFVNVDVSSSINITLGANSTGWKMTLRPGGEPAVIPFSGSTIIWAEASGSVPNASAQLKYAIVSQN